MNKFVGVAIGLTIASLGAAVVIKTNKEQEAAERRAASRKAFRAKLKRSSEVAAEVREEQQEAARKERERLADTPEAKLKSELIMMGSWLGLKYNFNNAELFEKAITTAELMGYQIGSTAIVPFLITSIRAKELNPDWSAEQCTEVGKIAVSAMNSLGDNYHQNSVFLVVDDIVNFETINPDNANVITGIIVAYASKKAAYRSWAA